MQQPVAPPPVWSGPHIPAGLLPWQLSTNTFQNASSARAPLGLSGGHRPLRRTVSSPGRRRYNDNRTYLFGEVNQVPSPTGFIRDESEPVNLPVKQTSSPIEIPDSPSSPSVITVSSSSDEMEPNSLETNRTDHTSHRLDDVEDEDVDEDEPEQCDVTKHDELCDGFGDDEDEDDEDDCIVTSSFSIESASPGLNESMDHAHSDAGLTRGISTDEMVTSTTYENPGDVANPNDHARNFNDGRKDNAMIYCSDTESADEKGEITDVTDSYLQLNSNTGQPNPISVAPTLAHSQHYSADQMQNPFFGAHHFEHAGHHRSPTKVSRPSSLGVIPQYGQPVGPSYISPTLAYPPSQTLLVPGNEARCCGGNDSFSDSNPLVILPPTHAQFVPQPLYTGVARISTAGPVSGHVPYSYVTSAAGTGPSYVNPALPPRQVLSRGGCPASMQPGLTLTGVGYQAPPSFVSQRYQNPVVGPMKTFNVLPNGTYNGYGGFILNSSPTKQRVFYP